MPYDVSDSVPIAWDVRDAAGALVNASTAVLTVMKPDGTTELPPVTNPPSVTGQYRNTYVPAAEGRYAWRAVTTSPNTSYQGVFVVRGTVSPALLSLEDAKAHLNILSTSTDDELREFIEGITPVVEKYVGPIVRRTHTARVCGYRSHIALPHTQVRSITSVTLIRDGSSPITLSDLAVNTESGVVSYKNGVSFPYGDMDFTYVVGRDTVEANWTLAAKIILQHNWRSQLGNLPSNQGEDRGYVVTGAGYVVPFQAIGYMEPDQVAVGFA